MTSLHRITTVIILFMVHALALIGQGHEGHAMVSTAEDTSTVMPFMYSSTSLSLPMTRNGSGTGWQPDASPMYAAMSHDLYGWQVMLNNAEYRHNSGFSAPNYGMAMAQRQIGTNGLLSLQLMLSADALTVGGAGYPLLFQTGETWEGRSLVDHQHPHDLFSSLAVSYTQRFSESVDANIYLGYPGEPALGPTAFMHRASSIANPDAPLSHHWMDATHITFGVATAGLRWESVKLEGSIFTGREPDENRYDFDPALFDSYSWRLSWAPNRHVVAQVSQGFLHQPEPTSSNDVLRSTASVQVAGGSSTTWWSGIAAVAHNNAGHGHEEWAVLLEGSLDVDGTLPYFRSEWVQKSWDELQIDTGEGHDRLANILAISLGVSQKLVTLASLDLSIGAQATLHAIPDDLNSSYGRLPLSVQAYVRLTPALFAHF